MNRVGRVTVKIIRYATEDGLVILSFTLEDPPRNLHQLQTALNTLTLSEIELIIVRSLFDLNHDNHRIYAINDVTVIEQNIFNIIGAREAIIWRRDVNDEIILEYEWI